MISDREWIEITRRNARSVQTTIGWIFWDPTAVVHYEALGLPGPLGYIAARAAPLAPAGPDAVIAAFASISTVVVSVGPRDFEPPCELLLVRVDETAGPNYQPASRIRTQRNAP